jgi:Protein of unknown function (DUF3145)
MSGKAALSCLVSCLEDHMSTTRGVLYIHSAPSALCPHVEWAVGGVFGAPVRVDWIPQPIERSAYRTEYSWAGPTGTAARLASALKGPRLSGTRTRRPWESSTPSPASTATS